MLQLVTYLEQDFIKHERVARDSTIVFFNNFSKWFDTDMPGVGMDYNRAICTQVGEAISPFFLFSETNAVIKLGWSVSADSC